jgi:hypothetical protein
MLGDGLIFLQATAASPLAGNLRNGSLAFELLMVALAERDAL